MQYSPDGDYAGSMDIMDQISAMQPSARSRPDIIAWPTDIGMPLKQLKGHVNLTQETKRGGLAPTFRTIIGDIP